MGETVTLTYTVQVDDHHGGVVSQPVTITITGTNDTPVITSATSNAFSELPGTNNAATDTVSGTISFTDVDLSDRPTVTAPFASYNYIAADGHTALTLTAGQQSALETALAIVPAAGNTDNGSASWTYSVADKALDFLAQNETLTLTYTATVNDHHGGVVTQPITITITGTIDAPTLTLASNTLHVNEENSIALNISAADVDTHASLSVTIAGVPSDATLTSATDQAGISYNSVTHTWTVAAAALSDLKLNAGEDGPPATLTVTAHNQEGAATADSAAQTISLTVEPVPEAPVLGGATSATVTMGGLVTLGVTETKFDADDTLGNVTITGLPHDLADFSGGSLHGEAAAPGPARRRSSRR